MSDRNKHVIVTGGTGALGRAVVQRFLAAGDQVWVPWIEKRERDEVLELCAAEIESKKLILTEADITDDAAALALVASVGDVDVLIHGVGGFGGGSPLHETGPELWKHMFRINLETVLCMSRAVIPGMIQRRAGAIVGVSSVAVENAPAGLSAYACSKAAVATLLRTLQHEVANAGVRVNAVVPTTIDTPANRAAMPDADFSSWTSSDAIASTIYWLSSDAARAVRGAFVPV